MANKLIVLIFFLKRTIKHKLTTGRNLQKFIGIAKQTLAIDETVGFLSKTVLLYYYS